MNRFVLFALLFVPSFASAQEVLFQDGFESGDGSAWTATFPMTSYTDQGCRTGQFCGRQELVVACDKGAYWRKSFRYSGGKLYARASWRFPPDHSFTPNPVCAQSSDLKALFFETESGRNRLFVNFRNGAGDRARIGFRAEGFLNNPFHYGFQDAWIVADGQWHTVEVEIDRIPNGGHVKMWLDGTKFADADVPVCGETCPVVTDIKVGAYHNYAQEKPQHLFLDDVLVATARIPESEPVPIPEPKPQPEPAPAPDPTNYLTEKDLLPILEALVELESKIVEASAELSEIQQSRVRALIRELVDGAPVSTRIELPEEGLQ